MFTAIGRAYLAFCSDTEREAIVRNLAATDTPEGPFARKRHAVDRLVAETRKRGYGAREGGILPQTGSIAVPVMWRGRVIACINCTTSCRRSRATRWSSAISAHARGGGEDRGGAGEKRPDGAGVGAAAGVVPGLHERRARFEARSARTSA